MKRILTIALLLCALPASAVASHGSYPETIPLPNGWQPEGIATDGDTFFAGSRATGSIYRGNLRSGQGEILVQRTGGAALGMKVDKRDRLFVAGGGTGTARVYDADDGDLLREYVLTTGTTFVNDVIVTKHAAVLHRLPAAAAVRPRPRAPRPAPGERPHAAADRPARSHGVPAQRHRGDQEAADRGPHLSRQALRDRPAHRRTDEIELDGAPVTNGDGLLLEGRLLYVVQNSDNRDRCRQARPRPRRRGRSCAT